jgi:hypothetical protein
VVDGPQPRTVRLTPRDLRRRASAGQPGRGERQAAVAQRRTLAAGREDRPVRQQFPVHPADLVMADNDSSGREGEHRVRFVQRDQPLHVPGVRTLEKEFTEVLRRPRRRVTIRRGHGRHPLRPVAVGKYSGTSAISR